MTFHLITHSNKPQHCKHAYRESPHIFRTFFFALIFTVPGNNGQDHGGLWDEFYAFCIAIFIQTANF